jgi:hypothetical protein
VSEFRDYLSGLRQAVAAAHAKGKSGAAVVRAVKTSLEARYGQWSHFSIFAEENIRQMDAELRGVTPIPLPPAQH